MDTIQDSRLTTFLQKELTKRNVKDYRLKKNIYCGCQRVTNASPAVFLVTNKKTSHFYGLARCGSSWGCPTCTPKKMAMYGTRIGAAIDALAKNQQQLAFMITFTIPHLKFMTIEDSYNILQKTWRSLIDARHKQKTKQYTLKADIGTDKRAVGKKGDTVTYTLKLNKPFSIMKDQLQITHSVRVYEFTWGYQNSWHPHIHALFWVPKHLFDKLNDRDWETEISHQWWQAAKHHMKKLYKQKHPNKNETLTELVFDDKKLDIHNCVHISKDKTGKVAVAESSNYICGWSSDTEITEGGHQNHKTAKTGHYNPQQILQKAYDTRHENNDQWIDLYIEYLKATHGHKRVHFSRGLNKIIQNWMKTNQWIEVMKKKLTDKATVKNQVVCWFNDEQWQQISFFHLQTKLLELSLLENDARKQIDKFLEEYDIKPSPRKHPFEKFFENDTYIDNYIKTAQKSA